MVHYMLTHKQASLLSSQRKMLRNECALFGLSKLNLPSAYSMHKRFQGRARGEQISWFKRNRKKKRMTNLGICSIKNLWTLVFSIFILELTWVIFPLSEEYAYKAVCLYKLITTRFENLKWVCKELIFTEDG